MCGFCGEDLSTWDQREKHIANHFKEGLTMESWKLDVNAEGGAGGAENLAHSHSHSHSHQHHGHMHPHTHNTTADPFPTTQALSSAHDVLTTRPTAFDFSTTAPAPGLSNSLNPNSYFSTTAPPLPDLSANLNVGVNTNSMADMCGAEFFDWPGASQAMDPQQIQYPVISDGFERSYLAGTQGDFENALDSVLGSFGQGADGLNHQPWSGV